MRRISFLLAVLAISCTLPAQSNQASWSNLSGLRIGQKIQITDTASKKHSGVFESISDTAIIYTDATGEKSIQKQDVRRINVVTTKDRGHHTLVGAVVGAAAGAGVGAIIGASVYKGCSQQAFCLDVLSRGELAGIGAAAGGVGGGITGAIIGTVVPTRSTLYNINAH